MTETVYLSLGTNLGDRNAHLYKALEYLDAVMERVALSDVIETKAVGFDGADFLNAVAAYRTSFSPERLLDVCKEIEQKMGREDRPEYTPEGKRIYHDRIIDIDILEYGKLEMKSGRLTIPHPHLAERPFFQELLEETKRRVSRN